MISSVLFLIDQVPTANSCICSSAVVVGWQVTSPVAFLFLISAILPVEHLIHMLSLHGHVQQDDATVHIDISY
jgi:hypothetical protein